MRDISPSMKDINDTLHCMVTCNKEPSRFSLLKSVVESFERDPDWAFWQDHFVVFDNDSSFEFSKDFINDHFKNVFWSKKNYGYWTAVSWLSSYADKMGYKFIYLIESDCPHYNIGNLRHARYSLEIDESIGMVRTSKFSIRDKHLYDKRDRRENSNIADWFVQYNMFTDKSATFEKTQSPLIWKTNLVGKVVGLHRVKELKESLDKLKGRNFSEIDFQRSFLDLFDHSSHLNMEVLYKL